ncbi:hypothetical protein FHR83_003243 [Actinoplanes campanulatus]|uniref:Peptidase MA superfamily protein n=1 Tax=Actinoplanes campanulatus TaxID=113559 RepID=A0A7W5FEI8_9ACTN|nr:hypothetical protein [Actinoplanes campanulatus]MBB3095573.1 hypothetical protein [Actinoplanes campanulatus]GGN09934.1 hypothetical protein GCM10010109_19480 [Actinoplanes campanulatus]GID36466.1 hypothetical protein Aca09nite_29720 [Actinoplanes campanulatus]
MADLHVSKKAAALAVTVLAVVAGAAVFWPERERPATATPQPSASPSYYSPEAEARADIKEAFDAQAKALVAGDERGWLAPLDPALHGRFRMLYRNLRTLEVSHAQIDFLFREYGESQVSVGVELGYCLSAVECASWVSGAGSGPPKMFYTLSMARRDGSYIATAVEKSPLLNHLEPAPWQSADLRFLRGSRVIVAAPAKLAKQLPRVLRLAEKAAAVADRFAAATGTPPKRYRVYLADDKAWKTWYGGEKRKWVAGYHKSLNQTGSDLVLNAGRVLDSDRQLRETIQHEMGHAVTLLPAVYWADDDEDWLVEGIAEYIGSAPAEAPNTGSASVLRRSFARRGAPKSIVLPGLTGKSDDLTVHTMYAHSHMATGCLADRYGERKLLDFAYRVLRRGEEVDAASRASFGKPFTVVDKTCVAWIRKKI